MSPVPRHRPRPRYLADDTPEVAIDVAPPTTATESGALLAALLGQARARGHMAVSPSIEDGNRARLLYERAGFSTVGRNGRSDS